MSPIDLPEPVAPCSRSRRASSDRPPLSATSSGVPRARERRSGRGARLEEGAGVAAGRPCPRPGAGRSSPERSAASGSAPCAQRATRRLRRVAARQRRGQAARGLVVGRAAPRPAPPSDGRTTPPERAAVLMTSGRRRAPAAEHATAAGRAAQEPSGPQAARGPAREIAATASCLKSTPRSEETAPRPARAHRRQTWTLPTRSRSRERLQAARPGRGLPARRAGRGHGARRPRSRSVGWGLFLCVDLHRRLGLLGPEGRPGDGGGDPDLDPRDRPGARLPRAARRCSRT